MKLGSEKYIPRSVGSDVMNKEGGNIWYIMEGLYKPYTNISNGSPVGADAEEIKLRMIPMSDHNIVEPFLFIRLYKNKLAEENISKNILTEIS